MRQSAAAVELVDGLRRVTAPNPGPMTGDGTNTFIVGHERLVVVDPGPAIQSHIDVLAELVAGRIEAIVVTHTHPDHSPAAMPLAERTGAPLYGALSCHPHFQDATFRPDHELRHDSLVPAGDVALRAIHTPGHVDNHYCLLLEEQRIILAGDHLMQGSTVVIAPPQGDMSCYISSLQRMLEYHPVAIAPAHGEMLQDPQREVASLIAHRRAREEKIFGVCEAAGEASTCELLARAYDDVDPMLLPIARYSLLAHLFKLEQEGRVVRSAGGAADGRALDSARDPWYWNCS